MPCDYKEYPANWHTEIVPAVRERSGNRCEQCCVINHRIIHSFRPTLLKYRYASGCLLIELQNRVLSGQNVNKALKYMGLTRVVLTTAHLDHDKSNESISIDRLRHWCQTCHLNYDHKKHVGKLQMARKGATGHPSLF